MKTEATRADLERAELELSEALFKYHTLIIQRPELHLAYSRWRQAEKRVREIRRARREAEVFDE